MLLLCAVFALLTVGFVVPCVIDIAVTPSEYFYGPSKQMWLMVAIGFWVFGAAIWLLMGRRDVRRQAGYIELTGVPLFADDRALWASASPAVGLGYRTGPTARQVAMTPMRFVPPDDNPHFLLELDRRIRDMREEA